MKPTRKIQAPPVVTKAIDPISLGMAGGVGTALNLLVRRINNALERLSETLSKDTRTVTVTPSVPMGMADGSTEQTKAMLEEIIVPHGLGRIPTKWHVINYTIKRDYDSWGNHYGGGDGIWLVKGVTAWTTDVVSFFVSLDAMIHRVVFEVELQ